MIIVGCLMMCGGRIPAFIWLPKILGCPKSKPIGSMYGIYANIGGILMVNVTITAYMDPMGKCFEY